MVDLPWSGWEFPWFGGGDEASIDEDATGEDSRDGSSEPHAEAVVVCAFQDGTLVVYEDRVVIERVSRSRFDDTTIPTADIVDVDYSEGITIGYLQIEQTGVDADSGGLLSDPINANTVHFGRGDRECARNARDAILERARG